MYNSISKDTFKARIKRAFTALRKQGYVAELRYSCCRSCSGAKYDQARAEGYAGRGLVYTTQQDPLRDNTVLIGFGLADLHADDAAWTQMGHDVVRALTGIPGLVVTWNGSTSQCIKVEAAETLNARAWRHLYDGYQAGPLQPLEALPPAWETKKEEPEAPLESWFETS